MKIPSRHSRFPHSAFPFSRRGFTMIEIALCLAIIGFALVAIIGVLPAGLTVQKDNREETIINQDAVVWMNSIRNGTLGFDDLTNYVIGITNIWTTYQVNPNSTKVVYSGIDGYAYTGTKVTSVPPPPFPPLFHLSSTNIIGLLSTPKYFAPPSTTPATFQSNYFFAYVRAFSGSAVEKAPQGNQSILDSAFTYKLIVENIPYVPFNSGATNYTLYPSNSPQWFATSNYMQVALNMMTNSHDLRLTFRWPVLPNGDIGNGRVTFRAFTSGWLLPTTDLIEPRQPLFFFQPSTYVQ